MVDKWKSAAEFIKNVGTPTAMALVAMAMLCWVIHCNNQVQRETLTVIQQNTTAIDALKSEIRELRKER